MLTQACKLKILNSFYDYFPIYIIKHMKAAKYLLTVITLLFILQISSSCPNNCLYCQNNSTCITCLTNYSLTIQGNCISSTINNCRIYNTSQTCVVCQPTFKAANGLCVKDYSGCLIRNQKGVCKQCYMGTTLDINGNCLGVLNCLVSMKQCVHCVNGYSLQNNICRYAKNDCSNILANGLCGSCLNGYILNGFECVSNSTNSISPNSNFIQFCSLYSKEQGVCLQCQQGYNLFQNICQSVGYINNQTIDNANKKIRQNNVSNFIFSSTQYFTYEKSTYSLSPSGVNDILDAPVQNIDQIIFTGVGNQQYCLLKQANSTVCQSCVDGYYLSNGTCLKNTPICLEVNLTSFRCLKCNQNFALINGDCIDLNCNLTSYSICTICKKGFILSSEGICRDPNCQNISNGSCIQCKTNFHLSSKGICIVLIQNCLTYDNGNTTCIQCSSGYNLDTNGNCASTDPKCLKFNGANCLQCKPQYALINGMCFDLNCQILLNPLICSRCSDNFNLSSQGYCLDPNCLNLVNGSCIQCSINYTLKNGLCVKKNNNCLAYNSNNSCINCTSTYALINDVCVDLHCQNQQYVSGTYVCLNCKPGFNISTSGICYDQNCYVSKNGSCTRCADNYVVNTNGLCQQISIGCLVFDFITNKCTNCLSNYTLNSLGSCSNIQIIPSQVDNTQNLTLNNITSDTNCLQKNNVTNLCTSCNNRYYIVNGLCTAVPKQCQTYNMQTGKCITCANGYALYQQDIQIACILKPNVTDPNCLASDLNSFCIRCKTGYYITNGICYLADTMCKTFNLTGGQCLTCYDGYVLQQTKCVALTQQANCKTFDFQNVCIECVDKFYLNKGVCLAVNTTFFNNSFCSNFNNMTGLCTKCISSYYLSSENQCVLQIEKSIKDPNCLTFDINNYCLKCQTQYYINQGICIKVNPLCKTYDINNGNCTSCYDGYQLVSNNCTVLVQIIAQDPNCLLFSGSLCIQCKNKFYLNSSGSQLICSPVNSMCDKYDMLNGNCLSCNSGYFIIGNNCVSSSNSSFVQNSLINCSLYDLVNKICVNCYNGFYYDQSSKVCKQSNPYCKTTNSSNGLCLSCFDGYQLAGGNCQNSTTTINNIGSNIYCTKFNGAACIQCVNRYYVKDQTCYSIDPNCLTYNASTGYCLTCYSGYVVSQLGGCILPNSNTISDPFCTNTINGLCTNCLNGYYVDTLVGHCTLMSILCISYEMIGGQCKQCTSGSILQDGSCFTPALGVDINCALYTGPYCSGCNSGYKLVSFICQKAQ